MTAQDDPYVRAYYRIIDDPKFAEVYDNNDRLATWLRLLITADATYPAPAPLPIGIHKASLAHLVRVALVDLTTGHRYWIHGMKAERERRSEQAKAAAKARWDKENGTRTPNAPRNATAMREHSVSNATALQPAYAPPMLSAPLLSAPLLSEPRDARDSIEVLMATFSELTGLAHVPIRGSKNGDRLLRWVEKDGLAAVVSAARLAAEDLGGYPEFGQLVNSMDNLMHPPLSGRPRSQQDEHDAAVERLDRRIALKMAEAAK